MRLQYLFTRPWDRMSDDRLLRLAIATPADCRRQIGMACVQVVQASSLSAALSPTYNGQTICLWPPYDNG
jgi:hypothetical protein